MRRNAKRQQCKHTCRWWWQRGMQWPGVSFCLCSVLEVPACYVACGRQIQHGATRPAHTTELGPHAGTLTAASCWRLTTTGLHQPLEAYCLARLQWSTLVNACCLRVGLTT